MSLKERLLLLITPMVTLPIIMGAVAFLAVARGNNVLYNLAQFKIIILFIVLTIIVATVITLIGVSNSLTSRLKFVIDDITRISHGDLDHQIEVAPQFSEMKELVTAAEEMKHELKRRDEMVKEESAFGAVGRMASQIAHDLRSPVQTFIIFAESARDMTDEEYEVQQSAAMRSADKVNAMADELLNYAKARRIERSQIDLSSFLDEIATDIRMAFLKGSDIELALKMEEWLMASLDINKMNRTLTNLLVNGAQAIQDQTGKISLTVRRDGSSLILEISDSGKGIAKDDLGKIFEPSFTKGKKMGTGLGLAYTKNVIDAHGGTIEVASELGKGTTFTVMLPNCVVKAEPRIERKVEVETKASVMIEETVTPEIVATVKTSNKVNVTETKPRSVGNILIADDDVNVRMKWVNIVHRLGGTIVCAAISPDELMKYDGFDYSCVDTAIIDYQYDGHEKTGIDLISHLKQNGVKNIHLCTGFYDDENVRRQATDVGALSVIAKPIDEEEVTKIFS